MVEINLLPEELKKKSYKFKSLDISALNINSIPLVKIFIAIAITMAVIQALLFFMGIYSDINLSASKKKHESILPMKKEADFLKAQVDTMNKKLSSINELMVKRFAWSKKLNDLSDSIISGIWLYGLSYDEKLVEKQVQEELKAGQNKQKKASAKTLVEKVVSRYLIISGYASSMGDEGTALIGKFIKALKEDKQFYADFSDIELGAIKRDKVDNQEVMNFTITCFFKESR